MERGGFKFKCRFKFKRGERGRTRSPVERAGWIGIRGKIGGGDGDGLDFDPGPFWEGGDLDCGPGGLICREIKGVDVVHGGEIAEIGEENGGFDDMREGHFIGPEDGAEVLEDLGGLVGHVALEEFAGDRIEGDLAGAKEEIADGDGLGLGADGLGGVYGGDDRMGHCGAGERSNRECGVNRGETSFKGEASV